MGKVGAWIAARGVVLLGALVLFSASGLALAASGIVVHPDICTVTVFDIGQGDAIHIRLPHSQDILIDGGPSNRVLEKLGSAMPFFDRHIDIVVATHSDADHIAGLRDVIRTYRVGFLLMSDINRNAPDYESLIMAAQEANVPIQIARPGQIFQFASGARLEIVASGSVQDADDGVPLNDSSIVAMMKYQDFSALFTGDAGTAIENEIIARHPSLKVDVLKAGHHGSRTSTGDAFLRSIDPDAVFISAGAGNSYGHPHREVVDGIKKSGARMYRTDTQGDIVTTTDGKEYEIVTQK